MKTLYMRAALGSIRQNLVLQKKQINYLRTVSLNETLKPFSSSFSSSIKPMLNQTDLVNDKILALIMKDLRKFTKIFTYLKIRTDIRAMDDQVLQNRTKNPRKTFESQIIIC